jgi:hypothetical protein
VLENVIQFLYPIAQTAVLVFYPLRIQVDGIETDEQKIGAAPYFRVMRIPWQQQEEAFRPVREPVLVDMISSFAGPNVDQSNERVVVRLDRAIVGLDAFDLKGLQ